MRRKFWHGIVVGGLLGGLLGLLSFSSLKPETKGRIVETRQKLSSAKENLREIWHRRTKD
ncbi:MAG: hypothetical protein ACOX2S_04470 [bacterium]